MSRLTRMSSVRLGLVLVVVASLFGVAAFQKHRIATMLRPGETVLADFSRGYRLEPFLSEVKIAGVQVGVVTGVERRDDGRARVAMKVDEDAVGKLGGKPSAAVRPTLFLGGNYYVELRPGGDPGPVRDVIPPARTHVPVELDRVTEALQPPAREGLQSSIGQLESTLRRGGRTAADDLLRDAPDTLAPTGELLDATRGTRPHRDLRDAVDGLDDAARVLSRQRGQLDAIVSDMQTTSAVLDRQRRPLAKAMRTMPDTLVTTRAGLADLHGTLVELRSTAERARPTASALERLLAHADPALVRFRPVVRDLRPLLADTRPLVEQLRPTAQRGAAVLDDLGGPVLSRINGPVRELVLSPYRGAGPYAGSGSSTPFFQEAGYMISGMGNASKLVDRNGATIAIEGGLSQDSLTGSPLSLQRLFGHLASLADAAAQREGAGR